MRFTVLHSVWGAEGDAYPGGAHEVAKPSKALLRALGSAEAAGVVQVTDATDDERAALTAHLEDDAASVELLEAAQQDGRWQHGNVSQFIVDRADRLAYDDTLPADADGKLAPAARATIERDIAGAQERLAELEGATA